MKDCHSHFVSFWVLIELEVFVFVLIILYCFLLAIVLITKREVANKQILFLIEILEIKAVRQN